MGGKNNYKGKYNKGKKNNGYNKGKNQHYHHGNGAGGAGAGGGGRPQGFNVQLCRHFVSAAKNQRPCNTTHAAHLKEYVNQRPWYGCRFPDGASYAATTASRIVCSAKLSSFEPSRMCQYHRWRTLLQSRSSSLHRAV